MKVKVDWDTTDDEHPEGQDVDIPEIIDIPSDVVNEYDEECYDEGCSEIITDYLSDTYGWCIFSWKEE